MGSRGHLSPQPPNSAGFCLLQRPVLWTKTYEHSLQELLNAPRKMMSSISTEIVSSSSTHNWELISIEVFSLIHPTSGSPLCLNIWLLLIRPFFCWFMCLGVIVCHYLLYQVEEEVLKTFFNEFFGNFKELCHDFWYFGILYLPS